MERHSSLLDECGYADTRGYRSRHKMKQGKVKAVGGCGGGGSSMQFWLVLIDSFVWVNQTLAP